MTEEAAGPVEMLRLLLDRLAAQAFDEIGDLLHPEAVFDFPYNAANPTTAGPAAIVERLRTSMGGLLTSIGFTVQTMRPCADPEVVVAEYSSEGVLRAGGPYRNRYVGVLQVRDGRILLFREYYNPVRQ